jgi:hypothetical protein
VQNRAKVDAYRIEAESMRKITGAPHANGSDGQAARKGGKREEQCKIPYGEQHERNFLSDHHQPAKCKQQNASNERKLDGTQPVSEPSMVRSDVSVKRHPTLLTSNAKDVCIMSCCHDSTANYQLHAMPDS